MIDVVAPVPGEAVTAATVAVGVRRLRVLVLTLVAVWVSGRGRPARDRGGYW